MLLIIGSLALRCSTLTPQALNAQKTVKFNCDCHKVNNMWILKNSTCLLSSLDQLDVHTAKSVQTFDFSTLYTSIPHDLLKSRISNLVHNTFRKKDGSVRYTHIKFTRAKGYFTHDINGGGDNMFTADSICEMIEFLIDNIFVQFGGRLFHQVIGIPMGTNCLLTFSFTHMRTNF